jgi:hypothetical protein
MYVCNHSTALYRATNTQTACLERFQVSDHWPGHCAVSRHESISSNAVSLRGHEIPLYVPVSHSTQL